MNTEALFLFLILLLGLVLCSFLGGNCGTEGFSGKISGTINIDNNALSSSGASTSSGSQYDNYNHYTGSSTRLTPGSTFYGQNGRTATVVTNSDGTPSLQITLPGSSSPATFNLRVDPSSSHIENYTNYQGANGSATSYYGPNNSTATIVNGDNGQQAVKVSTPSGTYYYNTSGTQNATDTSTQYYGSTGTPIQKSSYSSSYYGGSVTGPQGNTAYYAEGPGGNTVSGTNVTGTNVTSSTDYYSALPPGIPRSQIPSGQEDLYILKSQVVPPVCPACPSSSLTVPRQETCPPCPACARCPEASFECKKVPNYNAINNDYLPIPVLSDFSQFGM